MCGIGGVIQSKVNNDTLHAMIRVQHHRGPDASGTFLSANGRVGLAHSRLSIIDLSEAADQPMSTPDGRLTIVYNGEIYNYLELKTELVDYPFRTKSDTEVILAAYLRWGASCLDHFIGMFAFLLWDERDQCLFVARDRFGVKPLYYAHTPGGTLYLASEIKAIRTAGFETTPDEETWATYLGTGFYDHSPFTFWEGITALPAGHCLTWKDGKIDIHCWYDLADHVQAEPDHRTDKEVEEEYLALLENSISLRFRSDVPVGINLSGGLDSSTLLYKVQQVQGAESDVAAFTFITGDPDYDELPWVEKMLAKTHHPLILCRLHAEDVPQLAESVMQAEDEPYGGLPTLAYARLFEEARAHGVIVLIDGQGMDEQWGGYSYYRQALDGTIPTVQGAKDPLVQPGCLNPDFASLARLFTPTTPFTEPLRNLQYRDIRYTKIPRAVRFNDRVSMRTSTELREPFLDHRLVELAMRQPSNRKIDSVTGKIFLRQMIKPLIPKDVVEAPKRPLQTPQREWLRGPLQAWADGQIEAALQNDKKGWLVPDKVRNTWQRFSEGESDNSFYIWQWISMGLAAAGQLM